MGLTTGYKLSDGTDIGIPLVEKSYLIDRYPELVDTFRFAGLWAWGYNLSGNLGDNTRSHSSSPVQTIAGGATWKQLAIPGAGGQFGGAAIKTDGTLWLWGDNGSGILGDNTIASKSSPVQTIAGGTNWKQVSSSSSTAAIKTDGTLWMWGVNNNGQLGDSTVVPKSSPVQTISGGTNWKQVVTGSTHTAAIKTDGTLWLWGYNINGQLGDFGNVKKSSPIQTIAGGTNWKQVSAGNNHTGAIKTDGTLWMWGYNYNGQLGNGNTTQAQTPVQTIAGGNTWKQLSCGLESTTAIKTDGTLWLWGNNSAGQLGDTTQTRRSSPIQTIAGGTNWKQVVAGTNHTVAIKTDGTLWSWGTNQYGTMGTNDYDTGGSTPIKSPVQTISGGTNWKQVLVGFNCTIAIRDNSSDIFGNSI